LCYRLCIVCGSFFLTLSIIDSAAAPRGLHVRILKPFYNVFCNRLLANPNSNLNPNPTPNPPQVCKQVTECLAGTYLAVQATATTDASCTACPLGTFSDSLNNLECAAHAGTCSDATYEIVSPTPKNDRVCDDHDTCPPGTFVSRDPTANTNRECLPCLAETKLFSNTTNAPECSSWTICAVGERVASGGTASVDRVCMVLVSCGLVCDAP
jgi:hypothetical protein